MKTKVDSFTLTELLIVMIITLIVAGMAFAVLRLVQNEIFTIKSNYERSNEIGSVIEKLWIEFDQAESIDLNIAENRIMLTSSFDTIVYLFDKEHLIRDGDTIKLKLTIEDAYFDGKIITEGEIDAIDISGIQEFPDYRFFIFKTNDAALYMNQDGF